MYKRQPRLPVELATLPSTAMDEEENSSKEEDLDQYMKAMVDWAEKVNKKAKDNIENAQRKQKKRYDAIHAPPNFSVGEKVWRYNGRKDTRKGGKLDWNWTGPYQIAECTTEGTYRLKNKKGLQLKQAVSSIHLKKVIDSKEKVKPKMHRPSYVRIDTEGAIGYLPIMAGRSSAETHARYLCVYVWETVNWLANT